jgi:hypothetical protein
MKKIVLILLVFAFVVSSLYSQKVTREDALRVGLNFYKHSAKELSLTKSNYNVDNYSSLNTSTNPEAIHIFNFEDGGFVIVSGDMSVTPILGYSYEGSFNSNEMNPAAAAWVNGYLEQIEYAVEINNEPTREVSNLWVSYASNDFSRVKSDNVPGVDPLIKTKWDQGKYYNYYCPTHPGASAEYDGKVVTGCVATAMAQLMNYYRYPSRGKGEIAYFWGEDIKINLENTTYNWSEELPEKLTYGVVSQDSTLMYAVAKLMFHAGVSVFMDYGPAGSSSTLEYTVFALRENFRFRSGAELKYKASVNEAEWRFLLKKELGLNRPVLYRGSNSGGGHAFICDGYQGDLHFHFNWGWSGANDGFYYVGDLTPNNNMLYNDGQGAIFNAAPEGETGLNYKYCKGELIIPFSEGSFDDGSGNNNYFAGTDCQWLLTVENADTSMLNKFDSLRIYFSKFDIRANDTLTIYDGNNSSVDTRILFRYNGVDPTIINGVESETYVPVGGRPIKDLTLNTTGKSLYFDFSTRDGRGATANGWAVSYAVVVKGSLLDVEDNTLSNLTMYPNPVTDELKINGIEGDAAVKIYDIYGKQLIDINNLQDSSIDVSFLSEGIYFIKIENKNSSRTMKFVKQ